jgi:formiminoglutamase
MMPDPGSLAWLQISRGTAPLLVSLPHTGTHVPADVAPQLWSLERARQDTDWWVDRLYDFAADLGATVIRTSLSRAVIDVNRPPSGESLYPGQAVTALCPTTSFDGDPLYANGAGPTPVVIAERRQRYFDPYHDAVAAELARLRAGHGRVVLYDAHAIRSAVPRLFEGTLPDFNIGTNRGAACAPILTAAVEAVCDATAFSRVTDGRFKGGWITRHYGRPGDGVHAIQMELACRAYMDEPPIGESWPPPFDPARAALLRAALIRVLQACLDFATPRRTSG